MSHYLILNGLMRCPLEEVTIPEVSPFCRQMGELFLRAKQENWQDIKTEVRNLSSEYIKNDLYTHWIAKVGITAIFAEKCTPTEEDSIFKQYLDEGLRVCGDLSFVFALPPRPRLKLAKLLLESLPNQTQEMFNIWRKYPEWYKEVTGFELDQRQLNNYFRALMSFPPHFIRQLNPEEKRKTQAWVQIYIYYLRLRFEYNLPQPILNLQEAVNGRQKRRPAPLTHSRAAKTAAIQSSSLA